MLGPLSPSRLMGNVKILQVIHVYVRIDQLLLKRCKHTYILVNETGPLRPVATLWYCCRTPRRDDRVRRSLAPPPASADQKPHDPIVLFTGSC